MAVDDDKCIIPIGDDLMEICEHTLERNSLKSNILDSVACSNAFFKSQQRGEKDLTFAEKREIAENLLEKNTVLFLQRYWKFIDICDVSFFKDVCEDYEVNYYVQEITNFSDEKKNKAKCLNRRYEALKQMVKEGKYFSSEEMRKRNPYLYEQLVGQYLSNERRSAEESNTPRSTSFSGFLMECIDKGMIHNLMKCQQEAEDVVEEEDDDDDEVEEEDDDGDEENGFDGSGGYVSLPETERQMLKTEFTNIMYENFLSGRDKSFDYSSVDNNEEYDSLQEREVDEEEKYFDAD